MLPSEESVYEQLKALVLRRDEIPLLSQQSRAYIMKHHEYLNVAQQYLDFWAGK